MGERGVNCPIQGGGIGTKYKIGRQTSFRFVFNEGRKSGNVG